MSLFVAMQVTHCFLRILTGTTFTHFSRRDLHDFSTESMLSAS